MGDTTWWGDEVDSARVWPTAGGEPRTPGPGETPFFDVVEGADAWWRLVPDDIDTKMGFDPGSEDRSSSMNGGYANCSYAQIIHFDDVPVDFVFVSNTHLDVDVLRALKKIVKRHIG